MTTEPTETPSPFAGWLKAILSTVEIDAAVDRFLSTYGAIDAYDNDVTDTIVHEWVARYRCHPAARHLTKAEVVDIFTAWAAVGVSDPFLVAFAALSIYGHAPYQETP